MHLYKTAVSIMDGSWHGFCVDEGVGEEMGGGGGGVGRLVSEGLA